jgi:hypothetical protein
MVALACSAMQAPVGTAPIRVTYDDDDREINQMERVA